MKFQYNGLVSADDNDVDNLILKKHLELLKAGDIQTLNSLVGVKKHFDAGLSTGQLPKLLFLDIFFGNEECTPILEFLDKSGKDAMKNRVICISSTLNPALIKKVKAFNCVADFLEKPVTKEKVADIAKKYLK